MANISIIYWSETGNTEVMAEAIKEGIGSAGVDFLIKPVDEATIDDVKDADAVILGSPARGSDEIVDNIGDFLNEMESKGITEKIAGAFGSHDWGSGKWMRDFIARLKKDGFDVFGEGLTARLTPGAEEIEECIDYGKRIAEKVK